MTDHSLHKELLFPRYWPTWCGFGFMWLIARLPFPMQMGMGNLLGRLMMLFKRRRQICQINIALAFPELGPEKQAKLVKDVFISVGKGLVETSIAWFATDKKIHQLVDIIGIEHLEQARKSSKGIILLGSHFVPIEVCGRRLGQAYPFVTTYKPTRNALFEYVMHHRRKRIYGGAIPVSDARKIMKILKSGETIWHAPDQNYGRKNSVFVPFFNIDTLTTTWTSRMAKTGNAIVVPTFTLRNPGDDGYTLHILPGLEGYPSESAEQDAARIMSLIEEWARKYPDQYLWTHRRFKDHPEGGKNRYQRYMENHNKARFD